MVADPYPVSESARCRQIFFTSRERTRKHDHQTYACSKRRQIAQVAKQPVLARKLSAPVAAGYISLVARSHNSI